MRRTHFLSLSILMASFPLGAYRADAAHIVRYEASTVIDRDLDDVLGALLDYGNWCEKGCKYKSPGVVVDKKLDFEKTHDRFYTWTWIRDIKDTKYFSEIHVRRGANRTTIESRALTKEERSLIKRLEKAAGRNQDALFDASTNLVTLRRMTDPQGHERTAMSFNTEVKVSGLLAMFTGKLKQGLKESTEAVFAALK